MLSTNVDSVKDFDFDSRLTWFIVICCVTEFLEVDVSGVVKFSSLLILLVFRSETFTFRMDFDSLLTSKVSLLI